MLSSAALLTTPRPERARPALRARPRRLGRRPSSRAARRSSSRAAASFRRRGAARRRGDRAGRRLLPARGRGGGVRPPARRRRPLHVGRPVRRRCSPSLLGGDPTLPAAVVPTTPRDDSRSRLTAGRAVDRVPRGRSANAPVRGARARPRRARARRRASPSAPPPAGPRPPARRRAAADAREALAVDPSLGLLDLARARRRLPAPSHAGCSAQKSACRSAPTGAGCALRAALERLAGGESDLARLAADAGFADHAHLTREMRALLGATPSALQREIARPLHQPG